GASVGPRPGCWRREPLRRERGAWVFACGSCVGEILGLSATDLGIASIVYEEVSWNGTSSAITLSNSAATVVVL
ncbi:MAG: hypothetical protein VW405_18915, partial [Rhodospirillaceae bacterium]